MASKVGTSCGTVTADNGDSDRGNRTFKTSTLAYLFEELRALAYEARHLMPTLKDQRQYIICGLFSEAEIKSSDKYNSQINRFSHYLLGLGENDKDDINYGRKFICEGRIAVLLNYYGLHGEARFLDPDGTLLSQIDRKNNNPERNPRNYLDSMKKLFVSEFGADVDQYIVLLSHLIPCTEEGHQCAQLIREYSEQTQSNLIISYDCNYYRTDTKEALGYLTHEKIRLVTPRTRQRIGNKQIREEFGDYTELARHNSTDNEQVDELDMMEASTPKRSGNKDRAKRKAGCCSDEERGNSKKKRRGFCRENSQNEWKRLSESDIDDLTRVAS